MLKVKTFKGGFNDNFSYILYDLKTKEAAIVETSINLEILKKFIDENSLILKFVFVMHRHFDHTVDLEKYKKMKIPLLGHKNLPISVDKKLKEGDIIKLGDSDIQILHCPGHTPDCICLLTENKLFTTDVLFIDGCGRIDLPESDTEKMKKSLKKLYNLQDQIEIYPGHDYGPKETDSLGNQKKTNPYFNQE